MTYPKKGNLSTYQKLWTINGDSKQGFNWGILIDDPFTKPPGYLFYSFENAVDKIALQQILMTYFIMAEAGMPVHFLDLLREQQNNPLLGQSSATLPRGTIITACDLDLTLTCRHAHSDDSGGWLANESGFQDYCREGVTINGKPLKQYLQEGHWLFIVTDGFKTEIMIKLLTVIFRVNGIKLDEAALFEKVLLVARSNLLYSEKGKFSGVTKDKRINTLSLEKPLRTLAAVATYIPQEERQQIKELYFFDDDPKNHDEFIRSFSSLSCHIFTHPLRPSLWLVARHRSSRWDAQPYSNPAIQQNARLPGQHPLGEHTFEVLFNSRFQLQRSKAASVTKSGEKLEKGAYLHIAKFFNKEDKFPQYDRILKVLTFSGGFVYLYKSFTKGSGGIALSRQCVKLFFCANITHGKPACARTDLLKFENERLEDLNFFKSSRSDGRECYIIHGRHVVAAIIPKTNQPFSLPMDQLVFRLVSIAKSFPDEAINKVDLNYEGNLLIETYNKQKMTITLNDCC